MKGLYRFVLSTSLLLSSLSPVFALVSPPNEPGEINANLGNLVEYFVNFTGYLGYDVKTPPTLTGDNILSINSVILPQYLLVPTQLLATNLAKTIVNSTFPNASWFNNKSLFNKQSTNASNYYKLTTTKLIDQAPLQNDPVSQAVLNMISTPSSDCKKYPTIFGENASLDKNCTERAQEFIAQNVFGGSAGKVDVKRDKMPLPSEWYANDENTIKQLNINSLIDPLLYTVQSNETSTSSTKPTSIGLTAKTQAEAAINYIKYTTSQVAPLPQPDFEKMIALYNAAGDAKEASQATLLNYLANSRTYAALMSVGHSNLYYILAKRMPQNINAPNNGAPATSQALNEYEMATRRLNNRSSNINDLWASKINNGSSATVQKEMALLLAEMNYQLYLGRQQQERMLLTQTMLLLQNSRMMQPNPTLQVQTPAGQGTGIQTPG